MRGKATLPVSLLVSLGLPPMLGASSASASSHLNYQVTMPDLQIEVPTDPGVISIGTAANSDLQLQFTHITWNAGPGPFVITPHLNKRTGVSSFIQTIYKSPGGTRWVKAYKVPLAVNGVFDPPSDYRYPLTSFTLIQVNPDQSLGPVVGTSPKTDYCITSDTTVGGVPNMPNRPSPPQSDCVHPNKALGLAVGYGDQYDENDNGQPIDIAGIPLGTGQEYLLRAQVDPQHIFTETNPSNDETDTYITLNSDDTVTVLNQTGPPQSVPSVTIGTPARGSSVSGELPLSVTTRTPVTTSVASVQYLADGEPLGAPVTSTPFTTDVSSATLGPGTHLLSARLTDSRGDMATAPVRPITVGSNPSGPDASPSGPPWIAITDPGPGQVESGTVPLAAVVRNVTGGAAVQFELDARPIGPPVTSTPYATAWPTTSTTSGPHVLTAVVTDATGATASSSPVTVTVANPAPPMTCFVKQVDVGAHGRGTVTTPPFRTVAGGETLVALVSAHGRGNHVHVRGAGLRWRLVRRVSAAAGVVEAFSATAPHLLLHVHVTSTESRRGAGQSLRVVAMEGVKGVGAASGSSGSGGDPHSGLVTTDDTSLVFAAGIEQNGRPALPSGWISGQRSSVAGDGSWTQYTNWPTGAKGTVVNVHDRSAAAGAWALVAVELVGDDS